MAMATFCTFVIAGNTYDVEPNTAKADASNGLWLRGDGHGHFVPVPSRESGFLAPLNVSGLALIGTPTGKAVLVANTGDSLQTFVVRKHTPVKSEAGAPVRSHPRLLFEYCPTGVLPAGVLRQATASRRLAERDLHRRNRVERVTGSEDPC